MAEYDGEVRTLKLGVIWELAMEIRLIYAVILGFLDALLENS